ncbi:hypothetical protein EV359DRAFT_60838 [Lentinula novae-zelandiae]|nr:hypothetical protein EV359DRAFT_60838 [Lentinula novae-zelandiae]
MSDSLDCFSLCFCCFCFSICGQSETSSCRWHGVFTTFTNFESEVFRWASDSELILFLYLIQSKFDDDPAMNDPELDAIVERQLYEQRAACSSCFAFVREGNSTGAERHDATADFLPLICQPKRANGYT